MKIAMNTLIYAAEFTQEYFHLFKGIKDIGFDGIEFALAYKEQFDYSFTKDQLAEAGLECAAVCGMLGEDRDIRGPNKEYVKTGIQYAKDCIDAAVALDCSLVAGPYYSSVGRANQETGEAKKEQWETCKTSLIEICRYAEDKGIYFALEPLNRFETDFMNTCEQAMNMISDVNSPILGYHPDTFHMNIEEKSTPQALIEAGDRVFHVHASENDRGAPGTGQVPWKGVKEALDKIGYDKWVAIESFTPDNEIIAKAASIWRQTEKDEMTLAEKGHTFLRQLFV